MGTLAELLAWDQIEERCAAKLENNGHPAHLCRIALEALLLRRRLRCGDQWAVRHMGENPDRQYFISPVGGYVRMEHLSSARFHGGGRLLPHR